MQISLIEFSVENYKIFKERATFSMLSRKNKHTFISNGQNLLKSSIIYGPNSSGKSTLLEALTLMSSGILDSTNINKGESLPYYPFLLSESTSNAPVFFESVFSLGDKIFKYNFSFLRDRIVQENLFRILSDGKEKKYISRKENKINVYEDFKDSKDIKEKTRKEVLFLSAASQWNNKLAMKIVEGFNNINTIQGYNSAAYNNFTVKLFKEDPVIKKQILEILRKADFCISDASVEEIKIPQEIITQMKSLNIKDVKETSDLITFMHDKFDEKNKKIGTQKININLESVGTQKFFSILGPVIDTINNGQVLIIDEFDNSLHPFLTKFIMDYFENNNPNNAQLIATTHDTSLLSYKDDFDRAQFWFTEKDKFGASKLISLAEFKLRNDTEFFKKYFDGQFGGLPYIDSI